MHREERGYAQHSLAQAIPLETDPDSAPGLYLDALASQCGPLTMAYTTGLPENYNLVDVTSLAEGPDTLVTGVPGQRSAPEDSDVEDVSQMFAISERARALEPEATRGLSDQDILVASRQGDSEVLGVLFGRHKALVHSMLKRLGQSHAMAEDLTNEAFLKAYRYIQNDTEMAVTFDSANGAVPLLLSIARRLLYDVTGSAYARTTIATAAIPEQHTAPLEEDVLRRESHDNAALEAKIECLSPDQQAVIRARFIQGLTLRETAALFGDGRTIRAVQKLQERGLARLRKVQLQSNDETDHHQGQEISRYPVSADTTKLTALQRDVVDLCVVHDMAPGKVAERTGVDRRKIAERKIPIIAALKEQCAADYAQLPPLNAEIAGRVWSATEYAYAKAPKLTLDEAAIAARYLTGIIEPTAAAILLDTTVPKLNKLFKISPNTSGQLAGKASY